MPLLRKVELPVSTVLYDVDQEVTQIYFLDSGFASQVIVLGEGGSIDVSIFGRDGLVGSTALLGRAVAPGRCCMRAAGSGYAVKLQAMRDVFGSDEDIRNRILQFVHQQIWTAHYLSACSKLHEAEPRFAHWILMLQDRLESDVLPLTQELWGQMLGYRRMTITAAAGALERNGIIQNSRGRIRILDREALEAAACECYRDVKKLSDRLYLS